MVKVLACVIRCFLRILEKFVRFFNKHAYTEIAMRSTNFCTSAMNGIKVIALNFVRFGVLHGKISKFNFLGIVELLTFFGSLFISAAVCVLSYYIILYVRDQGQKNKDLATLLGPMLLIFLIGWVVSKLFAHIWETSADAILHCYCIDEKI